MNKRRQITMFIMAFSPSFSFMRRVIGLLFVAIALVPAVDHDPLPSRNEGATKQSIITFVTQVMTEGAPTFVPAAERITTFDNDGALWAEQPIYFQAFFIFDRIKILAPQHPEWANKEPFASVLKGAVKAVSIASSLPAVRWIHSSYPSHEKQNYENKLSSRCHARRCAGFQHRL